MNEYHGGIHEKEKENSTEKNIEIKTFRCFFFRDVVSVDGAYAITV